MIALSPEAYRALMESGQAAADRDALAEAGLDVGPPLPQSLLRLVDDDNVLYAPDPDLERYRAERAARDACKDAPARLHGTTIFLTAAALWWIAKAICEAIGGR